MKMAVFFFENAFCVGLLQSFYDGGDLDENGCFLYWKCVLRWTFSIILWWGRSWWKWLFSLSKTRFALDFVLTFRWGRSWWKWLFSLSKMRFALDCFIKWLFYWRITRSALFIFRWGRSWWKWLFSLSTMRFALDLSIILRWGRSWWKWFCVGLLLRCDLDENSCFPLSQT